MFLVDCPGLPNKVKYTFANCYVTHLGCFLQAELLIIQVGHSTYAFKSEIMFRVIDKMELRNLMEVILNI